SYGGPSLGFMCATKSLMRKIPGRIVGATTDALGQRAFVLTLQAREQHIRREKATSNICSNQSLMALFVTVYMSLLGPKVLYEVNSQSSNKAHAIFDMLTATGRMKLKYPTRTFLNEMTMECDFDVDSYLYRCNENGILGCIKIDDTTLLLCATETVDKADIDKLVEIVNSL
ncbi:MAG: glycine dehydrogenase, partial [Muribaculaceae bacterium]|nr:glycine dehydrogenase [Muribaculaceae bacterium]